MDELNRIIDTSKEKHSELENKAEEITQNAEKINVRSLETEQNGKICIKLEFLKSDKIEIIKEIMFKYIKRWSFSRTYQRYELKDEEKTRYNREDK